MPYVAIIIGHDAETVIGRSMADGMAVIVVPGPELHQQDLGIQFQEMTALFHEARAVEFPVIFQVKNVWRGDLGIGLVDQLDLPHSLARAKMLGAESRADRRRVGLAIFGYQ